MKRSRRKSNRKIRFIVIFMILLLPLFYFGRRLYKYIHSVYTISHLKREILILHAENELLLNRIKMYRRGTLLEAKARDDLGMIKPGEKIYIVPKE